MKKKENPKYISLLETLLSLLFKGDPT